MRCLKGNRRWEMYVSMSSKNHDTVGCNLS